MLGNEVFRGLSNNDSMLKKYLGSLQRLEVMLLDPECPTREPMGRTAVATDHCCEGN